MRADDSLYKGRRNKIGHQLISDIFQTEADSGRLNQKNSILDGHRDSKELDMTLKSLTWATRQVVVPSTDIRKAKKGNEFWGERRSSF